MKFPNKSTLSVSGSEWVRARTLVGPGPATWAGSPLLRRRGRAARLPPILMNLSEICPAKRGKKTKQIHQHKLSDKKKSVTKKCGLKNKLNKIRVRHKPKEMDPCKQGKKTNLHQHKSQEHEYLVSKQIHAEHPGKFAKYIYI